MQSPRPVASRPYRLSVVMIVKNEADNLALSLPSVADIADEIIILDSGSTDSSQNIAEKYGAKWFTHTPWPGFGKQRQIAQGYASGDWILALDADEVVGPELKHSILQAIAQPPAQTVYGIRRLDYVFGHPIDNPWWGTKAHWRLYPRTFSYDDSPVHESVVLGQARTAVLRGFLQHHTAPTPQFWLDKRLDYALAWATDRHRRGHTPSIFQSVLHPLWAFVKQYVLDGRFLQGRYGLVYALLFAQYTLNKYAILYDLRHNRAEQAFQHFLAQSRQLASVERGGRKSTLSLVMITKNEGRHLAACLDTVHDIVDEIVILDSGSTDNTRAIAQKYQARWYTHTQWPGFGRQRQIAQGYATGDYVLVLDADERLDQPLRTAIAQLLRQPVQTDKVFSVARVNRFCGVEVQKRWWYADKLARLYARQGYTYSSLEVHESLQTHGAPISRLPGYLSHLTNDCLHHFLLKNIRYSHDWASEKHQQGKKVSLPGALLRALASFLREYLLRGSLLGGPYGYVLAAASCGYTLDKYLMLWEKNQRTPHQTPPPSTP